LSVYAINLGTQPHPIQQYNHPKHIMGKIKPSIIALQITFVYSLNIYTIGGTPPLLHPQT